jgi:hypothetical protein
MRSMLLPMLMAFTTLWAGILIAEESPPADHHHHPGAPAEDTRVLVQFPAPLREHMLGNMRIHVSALNEIMAALASGHEDKAAHVAEWQLGLSSLKAHRAAELGKYMPKEMQAIGGEMHRAASRFAIEAQNAGVTDDLRPALAALSKVTAQCVACHAAYRVH